MTSHRALAAASRSPDNRSRSSGCDHNTPPPPGPAPAVFALVLPRVRLVVGADTATDAGARLTDVADKLADAIEKAEAAGGDVSQAKLDLDMMKAHIASGLAAAGSVPPAVLGLTPADWNADHEVLTPARQSLREARADLKVARDLAQKIRAELKPPAASPGV